MVGVTVIAVVLVVVVSVVDCRIVACSTIAVGHRIDRNKNRWKMPIVIIVGACCDTTRGQCAVADIRARIAADGKAAVPKIHFLPLTIGDAENHKLLFVRLMNDTES